MLIPRRVSCFFPVLAAALLGARAAAATAPAEDLSLAVPRDAPARLAFAAVFLGDALSQVDAALCAQTGVQVKTSG